MKRQNLLNKKLLQYSKLTSVTLFLHHSTEAQVNIIIYSDIDPDETFAVDTLLFPSNEWDVYELDLDKDGKGDIKFSASVSTGYYWFETNQSMIVSVRELYNNYIMGVPEKAFVLDYGDAIDADQSWQTDNLGMAFKRKTETFVMQSGYWLHADTNKYMGVKFLIDSAYHYGWVRLDVAQKEVLYRIKDYAYNTIANAGLLAGQTELITSAQNVEQEDPVHIYQSENSIYISIAAPLRTSNFIRISNLSGQVIYEDQLHSAETKIELEYNNVYLISVFINGNMYSRKIVL